MAHRDWRKPPDAPTAEMVSGSLGVVEDVVGRAPICGASTIEAQNSKSAAGYVAGDGWSSSSFGAIG